MVRRYCYSRVTWAAPGPNLTSPLLVQRSDPSVETKLLARCARSRSRGNALTAARLEKEASIRREPHCCTPAATATQLWPVDTAAMSLSRCSLPAAASRSALARSGCLVDRSGGDTVVGAGRACASSAVGIRL